MNQLFSSVFMRFLQGHQLFHFIETFLCQMEETESKLDVTIKAKQPEPGGVFEKQCVSVS